MPSSSNRVPGGICLLAQGPIACPEYLHCLEATTDGCSHYVGDTENATQAASTAAGKAKQAATDANFTPASDAAKLAQDAADAANQVATTDSPMPEPGECCSGCPCRNGSKMASRSSAGIPGPESSTTMSTSWEI